MSDPVASSSTAIYRQAEDGSPFSSGAFKAIGETFSHEATDPSELLSVKATVPGARSIKHFYPVTNEAGHGKIYRELEKAPALGNTVIGVSGLQLLEIFVRRPPEVNFLVVIDPCCDTAKFWQMVQETIVESATGHEALRTIKHRLYYEFATGSFENSNLACYVNSDQNAFLRPEGFGRIKELVENKRLLILAINLEHPDKAKELADRLAVIGCFPDTIYLSNVASSHWTKNPAIILQSANHLIPPLSSTFPQETHWLLTGKRHCSCKQKLQLEMVTTNVLDRIPPASCGRFSNHIQTITLKVKKFSRPFFDFLTGYTRSFHLSPLVEGLQGVRERFVRYRDLLNPEQAFLLNRLLEEFETLFQLETLQKHADNPISLTKMRAIFQEAERGILEQRPLFQRLVEFNGVLNPPPVGFTFLFSIYSYLHLLSTMMKNTAVRTPAFLKWAKTGEMPEGGDYRTFTQSNLPLEGEFLAFSHNLPFYLRLLEQDPSPDTREIDDFIKVTLSDFFDQFNAPLRNNPSLLQQRLAERFSEKKIEETRLIDIIEELFSYRDTQHLQNAGPSSSRSLSDFDKTS